MGAAFFLARRILSTNYPPQKTRKRIMETNAMIKLCFGHRRFSAEEFKIVFDDYFNAIAPLATRNLATYEQTLAYYVSELGHLIKDGDTYRVPLHFDLQHPEGWKSKYEKLGEAMQAFKEHLVPTRLYQYEADTRENTNMLRELNQRTFLIIYTNFEHRPFTIQDYVQCFDTKDLGDATTELDIFVSDEILIKDGDTYRLPILAPKLLSNY